MDQPGWDERRKDLLAEPLSKWAALWVAVSAESNRRHQPLQSSVLSNTENPGDIQMAVEHRKRNAVAHTINRWDATLTCDADGLSFRVHYPELLCSARKADRKSVSGPLPRTPVLRSKG